MGHDESNIQVLIGMGNNPGSAFNTVIKPTFSETGLGAFCIEGIEIPASAGAREGMNATIQVVTNGDPEGGLYNVSFGFSLVFCFSEYNFLPLLPYPTPPLITFLAPLLRGEIREHKREESSSQRWEEGDMWFIYHICF